jgi:hypothetical protein
MQTEKRECQQELIREETWNKFEEDYTWSISAYELNKASLGLGLSSIDNFDRRPSSSGSDLKKWVMDVFYHPSKYVKVIREIRYIYNQNIASTITSTSSERILIIINNFEIYRPFIKT